MSFRIHGNMLVKTVKKGFKKEFGLNIRIYKGMGNNFVDENKTIAEIRPDGHTGGEVSPAGNMKIGTLEDKIKEKFGIKVNISDSNDRYLIENGITLADAKTKKPTIRGSNKEETKPWYKFW